MERSKQQQVLSVARFLTNLQISNVTIKLVHIYNICSGWWFEQLFVQINKHLLKRSCKQPLSLSSWTTNWASYRPNSHSNDHIVDQLYKLTIRGYQWWLMSSLIASEWLTSSLSICQQWMLHLIYTLCQPYAKW